MSMNIKNNAAS